MERLKAILITMAVGWLLMTAAFPLHEAAMAGPRFTDNGDGTITDHRLGLRWAQTDNQGEIDWEQARAWARFNFGIPLETQYDNWRLPTVAELKTLYVSSPKYKGYRTDCGFNAKIVTQIKISCVLIWTSDTALGAHLAFNFNIGNAFTVPDYDIGGCRALAVRTID